MRRLFLALSATLLSPGQALPQDPALLLQRANQIGDLYNWPAATPVYRQAEQLYRLAAKPQQASYAHAGWLRATMETRDLPSVSAELSRILSLPVGDGSKAQRMRIWIAKAVS
jgi:hypothetical protein